MSLNTSIRIGRCIRHMLTLSIDVVISHCIIGVTSSIRIRRNIRIRINCIRDIRIISPMRTTSLP